MKQEKLKAAQCEKVINVCCVLCLKLCVRVWCRFDVNRIHNQHSTKAGRWRVQQTRTSIEQQTVEKALSSERCAWEQSVSTVSVRVIVCGQWWSGLDHYANQSSKARRCVSHLIRWASRCRWCSCSSGTCAARPSPTGSSTAHTPAGRSFTQSTSTRLREYTSTCSRRFLYSYSSTALTISGCGQWEAAGTLRATVTSIDTHAEKRDDCDPRAHRSGRPPASSPSARSADSERSSARSRASALVAPRRPPRSHKQSASPSLSFTCSALVFAQRRTLSSRQEYREMLTSAVEQ